MNPANIDVIVTGDFKIKGNKVKVKPLIINRENQRIFSNDFYFTNDEIDCLLQNKLYDISICHQVYADISNFVLDSFLPVEQKENLNNDNNIYISNLALMDVISGISMFVHEISHLIDNAVINGIKLAQKENQLIKYDDMEKYIDNSEKNNRKLSYIFFDPDLITEQKIDTIVKEMMIPSDVDIIVTGQYIDKGKIVDIRPLIIDKKHHKIETKIAVFKKSELYNINPNEPDKKNLSKEAFEEISRLTMSLLKNL